MIRISAPITKREAAAAVVALIVVFTAGFWGDMDFLMASDGSVEAARCQTYAVRIHEDNGWGVKEMRPPRFYCDDGHKLEPFKDGLIICFCEEG